MSYKYEGFSGGTLQRSGVLTHVKEADDFNIEVWYRTRVHLHLFLSSHDLYGHKGHSTTIQCKYEICINEQIQNLEVGNSQINI